MENSEQANSPEGASRVSTRTSGRVLSRDYAEQNLSRSPSQHQSRSRYPDFNFGPASLRHRISSLQTSPNPSPGPARTWGRDYADSSRRSVVIAAPSARGDATDTASRKFSLAGPPPLDTLAANQPYIDPGYTQLNPAYDQPTNVRPVWGLAKPLPRVLRPGMVPAKDELEKEVQEEEREAQQPLMADIEAGRIEPSLRPDKVSSQLDTIRREREISLYRAYQNQYQESPAFSPFGAARRTSDALTETPHTWIRPEDTIEEEAGSESQQTEQIEPPELSLPEAVANVKRAKEEEEEWKDDPYEDAVPLAAYQAEEEEIHNLHTYWSIIRLRFREPLAELLGIMVQYTLGFSANLSMTVSRGAAGVNDTGTWAWGFATMLAIYIAGGISGAHLNPAISLMLYIYRGFPLRKIPVYVAAQMLGAFLAALVAFGIFQPGLIALQLHAAQEQQSHLVEQKLAEGIGSASVFPLVSPMSTVVLSNFLTFPRASWVDSGTAYLAELAGTTILTISVLALGDDTNAPPGAGMNAFIVGLLVTVLGMAFGYITGLAMNPARDFGPRLAMLVLGHGNFKTLFADGYWFKVAWLGPISGAILGGLLYDAAIFVGGESPVNYPTRRIRRAARKWGKRWRARMNFRRTRR
ncbi:hypothetical protein AYO20_03736 [Fonsecaea nubica]|uniref:Aquaporin n=1 Tax=Fonsecaea nubica TaxID=856822 RepID=A0A178D5P6_9EURO|nr:hypothetical protein AYO20_03736 [Fonsecaea nubica]OAL36967.1 hypothetical protein AYO20_03736 [Fonsecaea nubica]